MGKKPANLDNVVFSESSQPKLVAFEKIKRNNRPDDKQNGPDSKPKKAIKTKAKAYGLKSLMAADGKILLTTFGPKEQPIVYEQNIDGKSGSVTLVLPKSDQTFEAALGEEHKLRLKPLKRSLGNEPGEPDHLLVTSPVFEDGKLGMDYLGFKPVLERELFGKEKDEDNIHIQIAYNVLDLKKIIGFQIGDVIQSLRNIGTKYQEAKDANDVVGMIRFESECPLNFRVDNEIFFKRLQPYALYYDGVFKYRRPKRKEESEEVYERNTRSERENAFAHNYNLMRILSALRQACVHPAAYPSLLFSFETDPACADLAAFAKSLYEADFKTFVDSVSSSSSKNLSILWEIEGLEDQNGRFKYAEAYLQHLLYRDSKNLGFNLKNIRIKAVDYYVEYRGIEDRKKFAALSKLNAIYDFLLYRVYEKHPERVEAMVANLRQAMDEEEKERIYVEEFNSLLQDETVHGKAYFLAIGDTVFRHIADKPTKPSAYFSVDARPLSVFAYFVYVACKFMDGKEINELTTSIINKFENIDTLVNVLRDENVNRWEGFTKNYPLFGKYSFAELARQMRLVKNLAGIKRKLKKQNEISISTALYADAINFFKNDSFLKPGDARMSEYIDFFFSAEKRGRKSIPSEGSKVRNFLANAIINNRRFGYLIKYIDPRQCRKLLSNEALVRMVLQKEDMPLSQLQRYYQAVTEGGFSNNRAAMVDRLVLELRQLSFEGIENFGKNLLAIKSQYNPWLVRQKTIVSLYLTVAYLIVKGVVHVNAFHLIAWGAFDRDFFYRFGRDPDQTRENGNLGFLSLTESYLPFRKKRVQEFLKTNIQEAKANGSNMFALYRLYRNKIVHLDLCSKFPDYVQDIRAPQSYFDVYAYAVQKWALQQKCIGTFKNTLVRDLEQFHTYQRDFLKIIDLPFAYNVARYKNLTIADLFNDKYDVPIKKK